MKCAVNDGFDTGIIGSLDLEVSKWSVDGLAMKRTFCAVVLTMLSVGVATATRGVMLMNRIGPSTIDLFVAKADGSGERKLFSNSDFDYNGSFSSDGQWIVVTSERAGYGQAGAHPDGSGIERLTDSPALDDQASLSPR